MQMAQAAQQPTQSPSLVQAAMQMPQAPMGMPVAAPQGAPQAAPQSQPQAAPMASGGLAGLPSGSHDYALGGIVSFSGEGEEGQVTNSTDPYEALQTLIEGYQQTGDPVLHQKAVQLQLSLVKDLAARQAIKPKGFTPEQEAADIRKYVETRQREAGPSPFASLRQEIATARGERDKNLQQAQGVALLEASAEALRPGGTMRGLAGAAAKFGGAYGQALQADRAERRALANMEMNIADAERKERMGLYSEARASRAAAAKEAKDAETAQFNRDANLIRLTGGVAKTLEPRRGAGTAKPPSLPQVDRRLAELQEKLVDVRLKDPNDPQIPVLQEKIKELRDTLIVSKDTGPVKAGLTEAEIKRKIDAIVAPQLLKFEELPSLAGDLGKRYAKLLREARAADLKKDTESADALRAKAKTLKDQHEAELRRAATASLGIDISALSTAPAASAANAARPAPPSGYVVDQQPK